MATKFGIRNYTRNGNNVTFDVVALNADGTVDTSYTGAVTIGLFNFTGSSGFTYAEGDQGVRSLTLTITDPAFRASITARFPSDTNFSNTGVLVVGGPNDDTFSTSAGGENLFVGGPADDSYNGNVSSDLFRMEAGGADTVGGGASNDGFYFGAALDGGDTVDGGTGTNDQIGLQGAYLGVSLGGAQFTGVETFALLSGGDTRFGDTANNFYDYLLTLTGAWSGNTVFNGNSLRIGEDMIIDASGTTSGAFTFFGGASVDALTGGGENDGFFFSPGTIDELDVIDGGGGTDNQVALRGDFSGGLSFGPGQITNIQTLVLLSSQDARYAYPGEPSYSYNITFQNGAAPVTDLLTVTGAGLQANEVLIANGAQETSNAFRFIGGAGNDQLTGGGGDDIFFGGLGGDSMVGGLGADTFIYTDVSESTIFALDFIGGFSSLDTIDLAAIDANTLLQGNQDFTWIGSGAFTSQAGQLRYQSAGGGDFVIQADVDGDGMRDFQIYLYDVGSYTPSQADFLGVSPPPIP